MIRRISDSLVEQLLRDAKKVNDEQLTGFKEQEKTEKKPLQDVVVRNGVVDEKELTKLYAAKIEISITAKYLLFFISPTPFFIGLIFFDF